MPCFLSVSRHLFLPSSREFTLPSPPALALCPSRRTFLPESTLFFLAALSLSSRPGNHCARSLPVLVKVPLAPTGSLSDHCVARKGSEKGLNK